MANRNNITTLRTSLIATLANRSASITRAAAAEQGRDTTREENDQIVALNSVIAHTPARNASDAAVQVALALEYIELFTEAGASLDVLCHASAALRSARDVLVAEQRGPQRKKRAA